MGFIRKIGYRRGKAVTAETAVGAQAANELRRVRLMVRWTDSPIVDDPALEHAATVLGPCSDAAAALAELRRRRQLGRDPICRLQGTRYRLEDRQPGPDAGQHLLAGG